MLVDQNTELTKQIDMLKRTNNMLLDSLKQAEAQYQQVYLAQLAHGERSD